ncbi:uncharacterized protein [Paramormyrops kingsleyae]|uniref:uncharacterized protein n=1 Tax=Paramormyrops kingsleyae TaxID=1676925 RepID=UPI003B973457
MPSVFLANVQSLDNKLDDLRGRLLSHRELRNCCVLCFTETWLTESIPDHAVQPEGFTIHRADRTKMSGKKRGGGVCFLVNNSWCTNVEIIARNCTPDLEYLLIKCRPFSIIKFADDTTVVGLISNNDETAYREEVRLLAEWCQENNLSLNISKTKEMVLDFRRQDAVHPPIHIGGGAVERVSSFRLLGVTLSANLKSSEHTAAVTKKAHQRLHFLRRLKKARVSTNVLTSFYRCTVESILTGSVASWYGSCTAQDKKALQRVVKTAQRITGSPLPAITDIYNTRCLRKTKSILKDPSHPALALFTFLPSGKRLRTIHSRTTRLRNSFYPSAIRLFNNQ